MSEKLILQFTKNKTSLWMEDRDERIACSIFCNKYIRYLLIGTYIDWFLELVVVSLWWIHHTHEAFINTTIILLLNQIWYIRIVTKVTMKRGKDKNDNHQWLHHYHHYHDFNHHSLSLSLNRIEKKTLVTIKRKKKNIFVWIVFAFRIW